MELDGASSSASAGPFMWLVQIFTIKQTHFPRSSFHPCDPPTAMNALNTSRLCCWVTSFGTLRWDVQLLFWRQSNLASYITHHGYEAITCGTFWSRYLYSLTYMLWTRGFLSERWRGGVSGEMRGKKFHVRWKRQVHAGLEVSFCSLCSWTAEHLQQWQLMEAIKVILNPSAWFLQFASNIYCTWVITQQTGSCLDSIWGRGTLKSLRNTSI